MFVAWCMGCSSHFYFILFWIERLWLLENAEQWMEGHWVCLWSDLCDGMILIIIIIKLRWALFVTYTIIQSITSSEMCSQHLTHPSAHTPGAVGSRHCGARGAVRVRCLAQGSHLSRGQFLPEPRFEPTTSGYKSDALSIRATTAPRMPRILEYFPFSLPQYCVVCQGQHRHMGNQGFELAGVFRNSILTNDSLY